MNSTRSEYLNLNDKEDDVTKYSEKEQHYKNVAESLAQEVEKMVWEKKNLFQTKNYKYTFNKNDLDLLKMAIDFFNEFLEEFESELSEEEKKRILELNNLINHIIKFTEQNQS